jgi:hypothetical protein
MKLVPLSSQKTVEFTASLPFSQHSPLAGSGRMIAIHPSSACSVNDDHLCSLVKRAALVGFLSSLGYFPDVTLRIAILPQERLNFR